LTDAAAAHCVPKPAVLKRSVRYSKTSISVHRFVGPLGVNVAGSTTLRPLYDSFSIWGNHILRTWLAFISTRASLAPGISRWMRSLMTGAVPAPPHQVRVRSASRAAGPGRLRPGGERSDQRCVAYDPGEPAGPRWAPLPRLGPRGWPIGAPHAYAYGGVGRERCGGLPSGPPPGPPPGPGDGCTARPALGSYVPRVVASTSNAGRGSCRRGMNGHEVNVGTIPGRPPPGRQPERGRRFTSQAGRHPGRNARSPTRASRAPRRRTRPAPSQRAAPHGARLVDDT
jgi:hypothetical protein